MATTQNVESLESAASEALREAMRLADRFGSIDREIAHEKEKITNARIAAARNGESLVEAADRSYLEELLQERDYLPEMHFAARIRSAAAELGVLQARIRELSPRIQDERDKLEPLQQAASEAQEVAMEQERIVSQLGASRTVTLARAREVEKLLSQIEAEGLKPLPEV